MYKNILFFLFILLSAASCKKEDKLDNNEYEVNQVGLLPPAIAKGKMKSNEQFVAVLYANLFQKSLSADQMYAISLALQSVGDQQLAREVLISNFMNMPDKKVPSDSVMRADIGKFIDETYKRFLVRYPSEAERTYFINYITADPNVTAELVYFSFALSDEYSFY